MEQPVLLKKYELLEAFEFIESPQRRYYCKGMTDADVEQLQREHPTTYAKYFKPAKEGKITALPDGSK